MKTTYQFLTDLAVNNNRDWMQENRSYYQEARNEFKHLVANLIMVVGAINPELEGLQPEDCMFRINRDVRFSKDKTPYNAHFSAAMIAGGKKAPNPAYYLRLKPGESFIGGGIYLPSGDTLKKIRQEIDYNPEELKEIVEETNFKRIFGAIQGESLKTAPKGYPKDHPNIELLRMKSFLAMTELEEVKVIAANRLEYLTDFFRTVHPFNEYLSVAMS